MEIIMKEEFFNKIYQEGLFSEKIKEMAVTTLISDSTGTRLVSIQENYIPQKVDSMGSLAFPKDLFQTLFERGLLNKKQLSNFRLTLEEGENGEVSRVLFEKREVLSDDI